MVPYIPYPSPRSLRDRFLCVLLDLVLVPRHRAPAEPRGAVHAHPVHLLPGGTGPLDDDVGHIFFHPFFSFSNPSFAENHGYSISA